MANDDGMTPTPRRNFGAARCHAVSSAHENSNRFRSPFESVNIPSSMSPRHIITPRQQAAFFREQYRPQASNYAPASYNPHRFTSSRAHSPYAYKNPQCTTTGRGLSSALDRRRGSYGNPPKVLHAEQFDVNDYVIPAMTSNPWAKLEEEYHASRRVECQK